MREVHCGDALEWLRGRAPQPGTALLTSLPDFSEFPNHSLAAWQEWFDQAASAVLACCPPDGVALFYQSDVRVDGLWIDKSRLVQQAAQRQNKDLLWHKIVCRVPPGNPSFGRPGYAHLLCFSAGLRLPPQRSFADVLVSGGKATWARGIGLETCRLVCRFLRRQTPVHTLIAPFCGQGLALAVAEEHGLRAIGIEKSPQRARQAERCSLS